MYISAIPGNKDKAIIHGKADKMCFVKKYKNKGAVANFAECKDTRRSLTEWSLRGDLNQKFTFTMEVWSISPGHKGSFTFMTLFNKSFGYNFHWSWVDIVMYNDRDPDFRLDKVSQLERSTLKESLPSFTSLGDQRFQLATVPIENYSDVLLKVQRPNSSDGFVKFLFELHQNLLKPNILDKYIVNDTAIVAQIIWSTTLEIFNKNSREMQEMPVQNSEELLISLPGTNLQAAVQDLNSSSEYNITTFWLNDKTFSRYHKHLLDSCIMNLTLMQQTYQLFSETATNGCRPLCCVKMQKVTCPMYSVKMSLLSYWP